MNKEKKNSVAAKSEDASKAQRAAWDAYAKAWSAVSADERRELLNRSVTPDCIYADPNVELRGHAELISYIEKFQEGLPGGSFKTVRCRLHHEQGLADWERVDSEDKSTGSGSDVLRFNADHLITHITGFFDQ